MSKNGNISPLKAPRRALMGSLEIQKPFPSIAKGPSRPDKSVKWGFRQHFSSQFGRFTTRNIKNGPKRQKLVLWMPHTELLPELWKFKNQINVVQ